MKDKEKGDEGLNLQEPLKGNRKRFSERTDEELILMVQEGQNQAYDILVGRYKNRLYSYLFRLLGNESEAEEFAQETFVRAYMHADKYKTIARFSTWLYTIATNAAIDARRRNKRHRMVSLDTPREQDNEDVGRLVNLLESGDADPANAVVDAERSRLVRATLDQLPDSMNAVIQLVYYQGMKYREAAEVLEIPVGTVKSRLHAAITKLTDVWNTSQVD